MGTDSLKLFNRKFADSIMTMKDDELLEVVVEHFDELKRINFPHAKFLYEIESVNDFESKNFDKKQISAEREDLVLDLCLSSEEIHLDYWGTTHAVFRTDLPEDSIPIEKILPGLDEDPYSLLLKPHHIEQILQSLDKHQDDLSVMNADSIAKIKELKDYCEKNPGYLTAYIYDF